MAIELCSVGGYQEVGKNMTAIKIGDRVLIIDMGIHLENYIHYTEDEDICDLTKEELIEAKAIPDSSVIDDWKKKVCAIIPTHAHLDHLGAIPFLAKDYDAPIFGTPYSIEVLKAILSDEKIKIKNPLKPLNPNSSFDLGDGLSFEFINMTHSTPQTVMVAIHTPEGIILYANDFKFDLTPVLGKKPNITRLKELGEMGVKALIVDSTYAPHSKKTPSEAVARALLKEVMMGTDSKGHAIIVTTFSSHIARLKSIVDFGKRMGRRIVFCGRSLAKYVQAAENIDLVNFSKDVRILKYSRQVRRGLAKIPKKDRGRYLIVATGHQGEPKATLTKMVTGELDFAIEKEDHVIFSCTVIPTKTNRENRQKVEELLRHTGARVFKDIHVSGHAAREDLRDLLTIVKPKKVIPAHGEEHMKAALADLASEMGYKKEDILLVDDGQRVLL